MRRKLALWALLLLALSGVARAASTLCVNAPGVVALTDARGVELLPNGSVEDLFTVREGALFAAGARGAYRLYDADARPLGDTVFSMIDDAGDALVFRQGGFYGAMDADGTVLLPAEWTQLTADCEGGWLALEGDPLDEQPDELIHIDPDGTATPTGVAVAGGLNPVSGGRMPFMNGDGRYGAVDAHGRVVVEALWQYVGPFQDGCAKVAGPEGLGLIDGAGRVIVAPNYDFLERGAALIAARDAAGVDVYPPGGGVRRFRLAGAFDEVGLVGGGIAVTRAGQVTLYSAWGRRVARGEARTTFAAGSQGQYIMVTGAWGEKCQRLIHPDGSAASGSYQQLLPLCPGRYAFLVMAGSAYYSAELGRVQRSYDYSGARYGLLDSRGRELLPARYREIRALSRERLLLIGEGEVSLANRDGAAIRTWTTSESEAPTGEAGE